MSEHESKGAEEGAEPSAGARAARVAEFLVAGDVMLRRLAAGSVLNMSEGETLRRGLVRDLREIGQNTLNRMQTAILGGTKVLLPSDRNQRLLNAMSVRSRRRISKFQGHWLEGKGIGRALREKGLTNAAIRRMPRSQQARALRRRAKDKADFVRGSNRLAENAKRFLERIRELDPNAGPEIDATLLQIEDNKNDLLKLDVKSWTQAHERLLRVSGNSGDFVEAERAVAAIDINRSLFNNSLHAHQKAVVRNILANASSSMAANVVTDSATTKLRKRAFVYVGAGPEALKGMKPTSRKANLIWRVFTQDDLDKKFATLSRQSATYLSWRGLGVGHGADEWYVPVPPGIVDEVEAEMKNRRAALRKAGQIN